MRRYSSLDDIMLAVCAASGVSESDILGAERASEVVAARIVFVGLARMHTLCSYPEIARRRQRRTPSSAVEQHQRFRRAMETGSALPTDLAVRRIVADLDRSWTRSGLDQRPSTSTPGTPAITTQPSARRRDVSTPKKSRDVAKSPLTSDAPIGYMDRTLPVRTLEECAQTLGITRQRAKQLEQSAFRKIRAALAAMEHAA